MSYAAIEAKHPPAVATERALLATDGSGETSQAAVLGRLSSLTREFAENVVAASADFRRHVSDEHELSGMTEQDKARARRAAVAVGLDGFVLGLDAASYQAALASLDDRALRKAMYEAFSTRASDRGPRTGRFDNTAVLSEMLELRHELARLAGFKNYAELALSEGVICDPDRAERYLLTRHRETRARAQKELDGLWAFAKARGVPRGFAPWDLPYYAAQLWREEQQSSDDELASYFAFDELSAAVPMLAERVAGVTLTAEPEGDEGRSAHHTFRATAPNGEHLGWLELDAHGPNDGLGEARLCILDEVADQRPCIRVECGLESVPDARTLVGLDALDVLLRCLGSALFLLLTREPKDSPRLGALSHGAQLACDVAGRLCAQFVDDYPVLSSFTRHPTTAERLPPALFERLRRRRAFLPNLRASQALSLTLFDLRIHRDHVPSHKATQLRVQVLDTFSQVWREQSVLPPSYWTRFANTATPIFVHGRAARLWELDWAEEVATTLYSQLTGDAGSGTSARLRETLWAPNAPGAIERLRAALGGAPLPGL